MPFKCVLTVLDPKQGSCSENPSGISLLDAKSLESAKTCTEHQHGGLSHRVLHIFAKKFDFARKFDYFLEFLGKKPDFVEILIY